jgi:hypothetical protein
LYDEAFLELNPTKLKERIEAAELAIREREIELRSGGAPNEELLMISDARRSLENLRRNEVEPPTMYRSA